MNQEIEMQEARSQVLVAGFYGYFSMATFFQHKITSVPVTLNTNALPESTGRALVCGSVLPTTLC
jgi:hypothetical protein